MADITIQPSTKQIVIRQGATTLKIGSQSVSPIAGAAIADTRDLYVSTTGNNDGTGTIGDPIETVFEACIRTQQPAGLWRVHFLDGDHPTRDVFGAFGADTLIRNRFAAYHPIEVFSENKIAEAAITITGYGSGATSNVATVSEDLTAGAHVGQFVEHLVFGILPWHSMIVANTGGAGTSTVTFADNTTDWGAFFASFPAVGGHTIESNAARIVQPATNPDEYENQYYLGGFTKHSNLDVDHGTPDFDLPGINATFGLAGGNKGSGGGGHVQILNSAITNAAKGIHAQGVDVELSGLWVDCQDAGAGVGFQLEQGGHAVASNVVMRELDTAYIVGANANAEIGAAGGLYMFNVNDVLKVRDGGKIDLDMAFVHTSGTPVRFADIQGDLSAIRFSASALPGFQQQGAGAYSSIWFGDVGRKLSLYGIEGSASALLVGSPNYVNVDGESYTLAAWNTLAQNLQTLNGCRVTEAGATTTAYAGDRALLDALAEFGATPPASQPAAIGDATGGATVDTEARAAINALLAVVRARGTIAT